jgi:hypothetical protein
MDAEMKEEVNVYEMRKKYFKHAKLYDEKSFVLLLLSGLKPLEAFKLHCHFLIVFSALFILYGGY